LKTSQKKDNGKELLFRPAGDESVASLGYLLIIDSYEEEATFE